MKVAANPNDKLAAEALGSTVDNVRDSAVEVSGTDADQSGDESDIQAVTWRKVLLTLVLS